MKRTLQYWIAGLLLLSGAWLLFFVQTDRAFGVLSVAEGQVNALSLESGRVYEQPIHINRGSLSRAALHLRSLTRSVPNEMITMRVVREDTILAEERIVVAFIDTAGATSIRFDSPLPVMPGEYLGIQVVVPESLSKKIGLQLHRPDEPKEIADAAAIPVTVDGVPQEVPAAYEAYYRIRPPLALQVGGLLVVAAMALLTAPSIQRYAAIAIVAYAVLVTTIFLLPAYLNGYVSPPLMIVLPLVLWGMYWLLVRSGAARLPAIFGAHIIAFTTWFPLHVLSGPGEPQPLTMRDIFLDTNQILPSHAAGSYIGFPALFLLVIGVMVIIRRHTKLDIFMVLVGVVGLLLTYTVRADSSIVMTAAIAYAAAYGLEGLSQYLGPGDKLTLAILAAIVVISLLDMWHVAANTFAYHTLL